MMQKESQRSIESVPADRSDPKIEFSDQISQFVREQFPYHSIIRLLRANGYESEVERIVAALSADLDRESAKFEQWKSDFLLPSRKDKLWFDRSGCALRYNDYAYKFIHVEGGSFLMGAPETDSKAYGDETPQHQVSVDGFAIGETPVTQILWKAVMVDNPAIFPVNSEINGDLYPVECVTWEDCQEFINRLNRMFGLKFSLPTEAEWEYAARGGKYSNGYLYSGSNDLNAVAWHTGNSGGQTHPVGEKRDNELGLYDMNGNVWEWCEDYYDENYYKTGESNNPTGPSQGSYRVFRGGCYRSSAECYRVSYRDFKSPLYHFYDLGLRLVLRS